MNEKQELSGEMTVGQLLAQVCRMSGHRLRGHMEKIGLHRGQGFALIHLWHNDGMSQRDLARSMHISPASVTNMLQRMERDGWIERRRDEADQRVVRVFAADKSKKLRVEAKRVFREIEDELGSVYTEEEQTALKRLLTKLYEHYAPGDPHPHHVHRFLQDEDKESAGTKNPSRVSTNTEKNGGESE
ncbi:MarR family transcriptional regulator [Candidatus Bipolaricaulota bacterium]|nr:MarR family transcriptional regulator [Candidatus Bipolaricaulota bacterium]